MPRPDRLVLIAGTGTEVGKTWVAAELARRLRERSVSVAARKPAQSFEPGAEPTDADVLAAATGEDPSAVCPPGRWYERALAPPMAARQLGRPDILLDELVDEIRWPADVEVGLVESAGGVRSPLAVDGDTVDLARGLAPDVVVLVASAALGTIDDVRLAHGALEPWPVVVLLNRFDADDELHRLNRDWLAQNDGFDVEADVGAMADRHPTWCRPTSDDRAH